MELLLLHQTTDILQVYHLGFTAAVLKAVMCGWPTYFFKFLMVTRLSQPAATANFHNRMILFTPWSHYVFVSLNVPVSILEIEYNNNELKGWSKNLKCCERNKQCEKWKRLDFVWSVIGVCSIYCMLNGGNVGGNISKRNQSVKGPLYYSLKGTLMSEASSCKYLGIILLGALSWADQVNYAVKKAWKALHFILRILN